jgi:hypothetical protein
MSEVDPTVTVDPETSVEDPTDELPTVDPPADDDPDKGAKTALAAEREARRTEKAEARQVKAELEALREAREEAQTAFNQRLVQAELKAALAGKVNNAALALKVIDTSVIDIDATGEVDAQSVTDAIEAALSQYPELKPADVKKFTGTADQGTKGKAIRPHQLSREELAALSPEQRIQAHESGQLDDLLAGRR